MKNGRGHSYDRQRHQIFGLIKRTLIGFGLCDDIALERVRDF